MNAIQGHARIKVSQHAHDIRLIDSHVLQYKHIRVTTFVDRQTYLKTEYLLLLLDSGESYLYPIRTGSPVRPPFPERLPYPGRDWSVSVHGILT